MEHKKPEAAARLVAVGRRLVRALDLDADVVGLLLGQFGHHNAELAQVKARNFFVQNLWVGGGGSDKACTAG